MDYTFGWRDYRFSDTCCGTENGEKLWYDLNGAFNVCSAEVVETTKEFERKRKKLFREIVKVDVIKRYYIKIGYLAADSSGKTRYEIVEIGPEEVETAKQVCAEIRKKVAHVNAVAMQNIEQEQL